MYLLNEKLNKNNKNKKIKIVQSFGGLGKGFGLFDWGNWLKKIIISNKKINKNQGILNDPE